MYTNIILIDSELKNADVLLESLNSETTGILYNYNTLRHELILQIENKFRTKKIERIGICCHGGVNKFLQNENFFDFDIASDNVLKTENTEFILNIIHDYSVSHIDFLACDSLKSELWKKYYDLIENEAKGVTVGASDDETGNIKYGGNWVMENTGEDIDNIYFNEGINYYKYLFSASQFVILGEDAVDNIFRSNLMSNFTTATHVEVHNNITAIFHNGGGNNYLYSMVLPSSVVNMYHHTWLASINELTYIIYKEFHNNMSTPLGTGEIGYGKYDQIKNDAKIFYNNSSNVFIGKYRMIGTPDQINAAFKSYIQGNLLSSSTNLEESTISINALTISPTRYTSTLSTGTITLTFSRPGMLQSEIETYLTIDSTIGTITGLSTTDGITWTGTFTPKSNIYNLNCYIEFIYDKYGTIINNESNIFSVEIPVPPTTIGILLNPLNFYENLSTTLQIIFDNPVYEEPTITIEPSNIAFLDGSMVDISAGYVWSGTITNFAEMYGENNILTATINDISGQISFNVMSKNMGIPTIKIANDGTTFVSSPFSKKVEVYDNSGILQNTLLSGVGEFIGGMSVNFTNNLLVVGLFEDDENQNIKTFQFDGTEMYKNIVETNLGAFVHLSDDNLLTVSSDVNTNEFKLIEYSRIIEHKATSITLDPSNIVYPNVSTNFVINLTTNDVLQSEIESKLSVVPSNVGNIVETSLTNHGFTLTGRFDVNGEYNISEVKLYYTDFSSNPFEIYSVQDLIINEFAFTESTVVTYENYTSNSIVLTLNRSDITNENIFNALQILPSGCGQIMEVSGSGNTRIIKIEPSLYIYKPDCNLSFHYTQTEPYLDASMTIPFSVETEQKIIDVSLNPKSILGTNIASNFGVQFRIPFESSETTPVITIEPSYIASMFNPMILNNNNDTWSGTIQRIPDKNLLYNTIDFSYNGFHTSLNFNVAQNPELIVGPRQIEDFIECKGIKITSTSFTEAFTLNEVEIIDELGLLVSKDDCLFSKSNGNGADFIMNGNTNDTSTIIETTDLVEKWFIITFNTFRKIKEITIYSSSNSVKIELLGNQIILDGYNIIANLGIVNIDVSGTINIASASTHSFISRAVTNITLDPSNIVYPNSTCNFTMLFSTNNVSLSDISNNYLSIVPNVANLLNLNLIEDGFKLEGIIEASPLTKALDIKLKYFETTNITGESNPFNIYTYPPFQVLNFSLTPENIVGPNEVSSNLQIEFNIPIPTDTSLNNFITIEPNYIANLDNMTTSDQGYSWIGVINRSQYMNKIGNKLNLNYTTTLSDLEGNYLGASAELLFDVLESKDVLKWGKKIDTLVNEVLNESLEISPNGQIMAQISGLNAKIYHLQSNATWSLNQSFPATNLALCDNRIAITTLSNIQIYEYNSSSWNQIGGNISVDNATNLVINNDGNKIAYITDVSNVNVYEYSDENGWTQMNITVTGNEIKFSPNGILLGVGTLDNEKQNFSNIELYNYSNNNWNLHT